MSDRRAARLAAYRAHVETLKNLSESGMSPPTVHGLALAAAIEAAIDETVRLCREGDSDVSRIIRVWGPSDRFPLGKHWKPG